MLDGRILAEFPNGGNHGSAPITPAGHGPQTVLAEGLEFHETPQQILEFRGLVEGMGIDVPHGRCPHREALPFVSV